MLSEWENGKAYLQMHFKIKTNIHLINGINEAEVLHIHTYCMLLHQRTPPRLLKAQGESNCSTAKAHPWHMLCWIWITVIAIGLEADGWGWSWGRRFANAIGLSPWSCVMFQCGFRSHFECMGCGTASDFFNGVPWGSEEDDVDLVEEDTGQHPKARRQYSNDFYSWNKLAVGTEVRRDKRDPNNKEYKHTKSDKLSFCKIFWEFPWFKCKKETYSCQEACIANKKPKSHYRTLIAGDKNDFINVMILVAGRRGVVKPDHTYHDLDKRAQEHQHKLQV